MRRPWLLIAVPSLFLVFAGYRIVSLDRQVAELSRAVGRAGKSTRASASPGEAATPGDGLHERVEDLEKKLAEADARLAILWAQKRDSLERKVPASDAGAQKEAVLSIIADEADRVIKKQLEWHRANLMAARKPGFDAFAGAAGLSDVQSERVWQELETEADELVNLFRIPEVREDPETLLREIRSVLRATDDRIRGVLDENQMKAYLAGRAFERASMPWLNAPPLQ